MDLGMVGYNAYGESVGWNAYNGERMPAWEALPERIRTAWSAAAAKVQQIAGALVTQDAVGAGYGGVLPTGQVVDRRLHPDAMPIPKSTPLGVPTPQALVPHNAEAHASPRPETSHE